MDLDSEVLELDRGEATALRPGQMVGQAEVGIVEGSFAAKHVGVEDNTGVRFCQVVWSTIRGREGSLASQADLHRCLEGSSP